MLTVGNTVPSAPIFISLSTTLLNWAVSEMLWSVAVVLIWYKLQLGRKKNWIALERVLGTAGRVHLVLPHLNFPEYTEEVCLSSYLFHHMTPFPLPSAILTFLFCIFTIHHPLFLQGPLEHTVPSRWNAFPTLFISSTPSLRVPLLLPQKVTPGPVPRLTFLL